MTTNNELLSGPVAITGANGHVGGVLQRQLANHPNPVRPLTKSDDWPSGIRNAVAVIHLAGTLQPKPPNTYLGANVETVKRTLEAIDGTEVQRLVFLSYVGAHPESANEYLQTKGQAEELIRQSGLPHVILRSTFIYGDIDDIGPSFASYQTKTDQAVPILGNGQQKIAPIYVDDLASLLVASAIDPTTPTGTFEVSGPETFSLDQFVQMINRGQVKIRHLPATVARLLAQFSPRLTPTLVDVLLSDSVTHADARETADRFGISLHSLSGVAKTTAEVTK